jgi:hypothetical protein
MAAITTASSPVGGVYRVSARSSATTVTDWILVPQWARYAFVFLQPTTIGTSITMSFLAVDPVSLDDDNVINVGEHGALTAITGTASWAFQIGPGATGIADDSTISATADSYASLNAILPPILGVRQVNSGTNVYNLSVVFRGK